MWKLSEVGHLPYVHTCGPRTELNVGLCSSCGLKEKETHQDHKRNLPGSKEECGHLSVLFDYDFDTAEHCLVSDQKVFGGIPPLSASCCLFVPVHSYSSPR